MQNKEFGFTIVEMLVVMLLVGIFSAILIANFQGAFTNAVILERAALGVISNIRRAQSLSIAGVAYQSNPICGYGIHYTDNETYLIYAGGENICSTSNKNYQSGNDYSYQQVKIIEKNVEFKNSFNDVFFCAARPQNLHKQLFLFVRLPVGHQYRLQGPFLSGLLQNYFSFPLGQN